MPSACILDSANEISQEAYYYGNWLMALSLYARTGGPGKGAPGFPNDADLIGLTDAINKLTDDLLAAQCPATYGTASYRGMWSYSGCGDDSSTTQFAAAGLAGAKAYYLAVGDPGARAPKITASLALAGAHYADFGSTAGSDNGSCDRIEETEKGFGYHNGYNPSLQQTSSGMWVQLLGGANVNSAGVQAYLRWLRNHYRWQDLDSMGNSWPDYSYYYYLWSSMKGLLTIQEGGIAPDAGNLGANSFGTLAAASDPNPGDTLAGTCAVRQVHKDPATVTRPAVFGAGGAGFYSAQAQTTYFDYAHTLLATSAPTATSTATVRRVPGRVEPTAWAGRCWSCSVPRAVPARMRTTTASATRTTAAAMKVRRYCCATRISTATSRRPT